MKIYFSKQISLKPILKKKIAVLGYGSQGRAQALNLKESGCDVVVGLRAKSKTFLKTKKDKIKALPIKEAIKKSDLICFLLPDEFQKDVYDQYVKSVLTSQKTLMFAHGFSLNFNRIIPPKNIDVFLIAPKGPGPKLRQAYEQNDGLPSLMAIYQGHKKKTQRLALSYAKAAGCAQRGVFETTVEEETITDLFGEQTVLCGGVVELMKAAFEALVKSGTSKEAAYFECFHELKLIVDLLHEKGISGMAQAISKTAYFGGMTRGKRLIRPEVKQELQKILSEIKTGQFAKEWIDENKKNLRRFKKLNQANINHPMEIVGHKIRSIIGRDPK